jgi:hypothetical protein
MKKFNSDGNLLNLKSLEVGNATNMSEDTTDFEDINAEQTWNNLITLETFNDWISVASYKIECLDLAIKIYRWRLQTCIMLGLLLSTASGTISVTQFGNYSPRTKFGLNLVLTITSFAVALLTGIVKTFKLQENLEKYINVKQGWVSFSAKISNEIYLPKKMRGNAETLIKDNKARFLDLLKVDVPIPKEISVLAAKHLDKGDDIESQYYKYRENIIKNEKDMNQNFMKCLSFFFNCCSCFYKPSTIKKILDNKHLEKIIKYSKIENQTKYKRRAYQYTLSSIMMNNVKHEYNEVKLQNKQTTETQTEKDASLQDLNIKANVDTNKPQIQLKIEETVAVVTNAVANLTSQKKKEKTEKTEKTEEPEIKKEDKKIEKTEKTEKTTEEKTEIKKEDKKTEKTTEEKK